MIGGGALGSSWSCCCSLVIFGIEARRQGFGVERDKVEEDDRDEIVTGDAGFDSSSEVNQDTVYVGLRLKS